MYRQSKNLFFLACTILAIILIGYSIQSFEQVPSLSDIEAPDLPFDMPDIDLPDLPINPEQTSLDLPEVDIGDVTPDPALLIEGVPHTKYLRLQTYDDYYTGTWDTALTESVTYEGETLSLDVDLWTDYDLYNITITPLVDNLGYIPTPENPVYLNISNPAQFFEDSQIFQVPDVPGAYEIEYILYQYSDALLNASQVEEIPQYLDVPDYLDDDLRELAEAITQNTTTDYEAILALENYLQTYYDYNLSATEAPPGVDPLEYFLFESGEGVCSHFNTALVMLARSLDFSARLVGGYYIDPLAEYQEVYPIQSHAFTEIPFEDLGWIIFDATPSGDLSDMIGEIPDLNLTEGDNPFDDLDFEFPEGGESGPDERVFRVYGVTGSQYLRDGVGEFYNGSWYLPAGLPIVYNGYVIDDSTTGYANVTEYSYVIEPSTSFDYNIPSPQHPVEINAYDPLTFYPDLNVFQTNGSFSAPYQVVAYEYDFHASILHAAEPYVAEPYVQITAELETRIVSLAEQITMYEDTPYEKMTALRDYLKTNYPYNESAIEAPVEVDPVVWFLYHEQQGICTDYASALTMLARSIGIPARLVTGWLVNPEVEVQDVSPYQAHAYTEALFDDIGWIIFDATPVSEPVIEPSTGLVPTFTNITYQDEVVSVGGRFIVAGTVTDESANPVSDLDVLVYLKQEKEDSGVLAGRGVVLDGVYNVTCIFPANLPGGEYMVDVHTVGDDTYADSWSDPPLVAYTETGFIINAPPVVVADKQYRIISTLVNANTNKSIPNTMCQITVGSDTYNKVTDAKGGFEITTASSEGSVEITCSWEGAEYMYGSTASITIQSVQFDIVLPKETILTRGQRSTIRGKVQADTIPGPDEPITLALLDKETASVTNEAGEFFITQSIPADTMLGATPMSITVESVDASKNTFAYVKAATSLTLSAPNSAQSEKSIDVSIKLLDDLGEPLGAQSVNITYRRYNITNSKLVQTDSLGEAETSIMMPDAKGEITLKAYYPGGTNYLSASTSKAVTIIDTNQFPLLPLVSLVILVGALAGFYYFYGQRQKSLEPMVEAEVADTNGSLRLSMRLPDIEQGLPLVWDVSSLRIMGRMVNTEDVVMEGQWL
ncbi:MAG: hypothetical protein NWF07_09510, partial [Candidatus Bathyarchaeota archaeon]|nr:hypothetical protein [Candidatus Bathyarchaeota archaeon]